MTRALLTAFFLLAACSPGDPPAAKPPEVLVAPVAQRDVPIVSEWLGTTEGSVDADIRAQVTGTLVSRDYQEGSVVKQGALLFHVDPRPFRAALDQAKGDLGRVEASLELSRLDAKRYEPLVKDGAVSRQEYDNVMGRLHSDEAALRAAKAAVERAGIELGFTEIRSPIDGIVGVAIRQLGDLVGPGDAQPLTTVSQIDPIRVSFPVSEQEYFQYGPRVREAVRIGHFPTDAEQLILADGSVYPHRGTGYPAGREVDPRTGTIVVKGVFPNPDYLLRPGQYARVRVETNVLKDALVVPQRAVQSVQGIAQLTIVAADDQIETRRVVTGPVSGALQVITEGVSAGDRVVIEGFQKVHPGSKVVVAMAPPEVMDADAEKASVASPGPARASADPAAKN